MIHINGICKLWYEPIDSCGTIVWRNDRWEKEYLWVDDGGDCIWGILINLTKKKVIYYGVNGEA